MAPFNLTALLGPIGERLVFIGTGVAFGVVLEMAGFGNSKKLAAQFYFRELTVLKVMFTAIVVAAALLFFASALGLLDYQAVWVNPTYLWPGIVGGLIMGAGFIIGGFCPGTSLVAAATLKLDGVAFLAGALGGVFAFGETVHFYEGFWNSSSLGRLTIQDWLGVDAGVVVLGVVLMALFVFWGAELAERHFGEVPVRPRARPFRLAGAGVLAALAAGVLLLGQPSLQARWDRVAATENARLERREVQVQPAELLSLMQDDLLGLVLLDLRPEAEYNLFHLPDTRRVAAREVPGLARVLLPQPARTVVVLMGDGETNATAAWKTLVALGVPNVYLLEGGINNWLAAFGAGLPRTRPENSRQEQLHFVFARAWGADHPAAAPALPEGDPRLEFVKKVKLTEQAPVKKGGCG